MTDQRNPPLPLDLDLPYNDDYNVFSPPAKDVAKAGVAIFPATKNTKGTIVSDYNPNSDHNLRNTHSNRNIIKSAFDPQSTTSSSRPSHKTHVEIITKNGATKKPNIGSNYSPEVRMTNTNFHSPPPRSDIPPADTATPKTAYDKKTTCMLYLQADHTFFQKMGSEEASIEAITRHVQRANVIYKGTGECEDVYRRRGKEFNHATRQLLSFLWVSAKLAFCVAGRYSHPYFIRYTKECRFGSNATDRETTEEMKKKPVVSKSRFDKGDWEGVCTGIELMLRDPRVCQVMSASDFSAEPQCFHQTNIYCIINQPISGTISICDTQKISRLFE